jgi:hypothetical protein
MLMFVKWALHRSVALYLLELGNTASCSICYWMLNRIVWLVVSSDKKVTVRL